MLKGLIMNKIDLFMTITEHYHGRLSRNFAQNNNLDLKESF